MATHGHVSPNGKLVPHTPLPETNIDHVTINMHSDSSVPKPHSYNGLVGGEYYCPSCALPVQLVAVKQPPKFCPFCGTDQLITDSARFRIDYSQSLHIQPQVYDLMMVEFHNQKVYTNFREYVECILFAKKPQTNNQYETNRYKGKL